MVCHCRRRDPLEVLIEKDLAREAFASVRNRRRARDREARPAIRAMGVHRRPRAARDTGCTRRATTTPPSMNARKAAARPVSSTHSSLINRSNDVLNARPSGRARLCSRPSRSARTRSISSRHSRSNASASSIIQMLMNCGSIAIALSAEYGDDSDGASSFSGRICMTD